MSKQEWVSYFFVCAMYHYIQGNTAYYMVELNNALALAGLPFPINGGQV